MLDVEFLTELLEERKQLRANLTAVQARCTELVLENRRLRGVPDEVLCDRCLCRVEVFPTLDGHFNERALEYLGWAANPLTPGRFICAKCA